MYELGTGVSPGTHRLTIRVDNRMTVDVGIWAHSVSDHTQGNWNGIVGRIELTATSPVWLDDVQAYPDVKKKSARLKVRIGNASGKAGAGTLGVGPRSVPVTWDAEGGSAEIEVALGSETKLWDEFQPALETLTVRLTGQDADDRRDVRFGLREIGTDGTQFTINGRKMFLRGTLECCIFPLTGYPPTDVDVVEADHRDLQGPRAEPHPVPFLVPAGGGLRGRRRAGLLLPGRMRARGPAVGDGKPIDDAGSTRKGERILRAYGNHPSFC